MYFSFILASVTLLPSFTVAYSLVKIYDASNFFKEFTFFTGGDPTHGDVQYVSQPDAANAGLIGTQNGQIYMGVDYKTVSPPSGRQSVRVSSTAAYNRGIYLADIQHMPAPACGIWPAYWLLGPDWPVTGEMDIIEGVNVNNINSVTLHTSPGCSVSAGPTTGSVLSDTNCNSGVGCGFATTNTAAYGNGFNDQGGGVYALEWTTSAIRVWFHRRSDIPTDITNGNPDPEAWGSPMAWFEPTGCDFDTAFQDLKVVFDTTFCGDWAGAVWDQGDCKTFGDSCKAYVDGNPGAFKDGYVSVSFFRSPRTAGTRAILTSLKVVGELCQDLSVITFAE